MRTADGLRSGELTAALARAVSGNSADLFRQLEIQSGLPGPRMNMNLAVAFAHDCAALGAKGDALAYAMAALPPDEARGASGKEFLSVCGVLAVAVHAAAAKDGRAADRALALLEEKADDVRFRVRDAVPVALASLGARLKGDLVPRVTGWMDRYFHATAVVRAVADPSWLETFPAEDWEAPLDLVEAAFFLAHDAPRSAIRYPGHKALVEALAYGPKALAKRFGVPVFDRLQLWAARITVPELRDALAKNLDDAQLKKPFSAELLQVKAAIEGAKKPPRDPSRIVQGMRGRGKKRR